MSGIIRTVQPGGLETVERLPRAGGPRIAAPLPPGAVGIGGSLVMKITKPDGTVRHVELGNANLPLLRTRMAVAMLGGTTAILDGWNVAIYANTGATGTSRSTGLIKNLSNTTVGRVGNVINLTAPQTTISYETQMRSAAVFAGNRLLSLMGLISGYAVDFEAGDLVDLGWRWVMQGLTSTWNENAAILISGEGSVPGGYNFADCRAQYSTRTALSGYQWQGSGAPTRDGSIIRYAAPNIVLSTTAPTTVTFWRIVRGTQEVVTPQAENTPVRARARFTGSWPISLV